MNIPEDIMLVARKCVIESGEPYGLRAAGHVGTVAKYLDAVRKAQIERDAVIAETQSFPFVAARIRAQLK